jgi:flavin-dependent dehydrogenase
MIDVIVVGLGAMGSSTAYHLARRLPNRLNGSDKLVQAILAIEFS